MTCHLDAWPAHTLKPGGGTWAVIREKIQVEAVGVNKVVQGEHMGVKKEMG